MSKEKTNEKKGQINLFGEVVPVEEKKQKPVKKKNKKKKAPAKEVDPKNIPITSEDLPKDKKLIVSYARCEIEYTVEERQKIQEYAKTQGVGELDIIMQELGRDWPELSSGRTSWYWGNHPNNEKYLKKDEEDKEATKSTPEEEIIDNAIGVPAEENAEQVADDFVVVTMRTTAGKKGLC